MAGKPRKTHACEILTPEHLQNLSPFPGLSLRPFPLGLNLQPGPHYGMCHSKNNAGVLNSQSNCETLAVKQGSGRLRHSRFGCFRLGQWARLAHKSRVCVLRYCDCVGNMISSAPVRLDALFYFNTWASWPLASRQFRHGWYTCQVDEESSRLYPLKKGSEGK